MKEEILKEITTPTGKDEGIYAVRYDIDPEKLALFLSKQQAEIEELKKLTELIPFTEDGYLKVKIKEEIPHYGASSGG